MKAAPGPLRGIYALTPSGLSRSQLLRKTALALEGGVCAVQYRDKLSQPAERRHRAASLASLCADRALFIVNDDVRLALEVGADGVHLGQADGSVAEARRLLGAEKRLGVSCRGEADRVRCAAEQGADYVAFGCCFPSKTKPDAPLLDLNELASLHRLAANLRLDTVVIGGIKAQNLAQLRRCVGENLRAAAVCEALFAADDVRQAARQLTQKMRE